MIFLSRKWLPFKALNFVLIIITLVIFALFSLKTDDSTKNNQKQHHTSELVMENNILTVYNPSTPKMGTLNLQLEKILEIPASKIEGEQSAFFGPIAKTKSGKILIGDPSEICVYIFSPEGNLVNRFLSRGEGPGQCMTGLTSIQTLNDYIWIPDKHKFMKFQNDGKLIEEYKFSKEYRDPMVIDDSHFMVNHLIYSDGVKDSPSDFNCITSLMDLQENVVQKYL